MRRVGGVLVLLLLAGCASGARDEPAADGPTDLDPLASEPAAEHGNHSTSVVYLRDPDVIGLRAPGLRVLNVTANATFHVSLVAPHDPIIGVQWVLLLPRGDISNRTLGCGVQPGRWGIRNFATGEDTLTGHAFGAGNWTLLVNGPKLGNLTLHVNTTGLGPYRLLNGTIAPWRLHTVDATTMVESENAPYRVAFNKTFQAPNRSLLVSSFVVSGNAYGAFRSIRSKFESGNGYLCAESRNDVGQAATAQTVWTSGIQAILGVAGSFTFAGAFESAGAVGSSAVARADVVDLGGPSEPGPPRSQTLV